MGNSQRRPIDIMTCLQMSSRTVLCPRWLQSRAAWSILVAPLQSPLQTAALRFQSLLVMRKKRTLPWSAEMRWVTDFGTEVRDQACQQTMLSCIGYWLLLTICNLHATRLQ